MKDRYSRTEDVHVWTSSVLHPKRHGGSLGFQCIVAKIWGGDAAVVAWVKRDNPGALPPFPDWEGVLSTEIGDVGRTPNSSTW